MRQNIRRLTGILAAVALAVGSLTTSAAANGRTLFIASAVEHPGDTVTLPLHRGTSHGQTVYFIITEASDSNTAAAFGINKSQKLANAVNTGAVQRVTRNADGTWNFPATVDFRPVRRIKAGPNGFPPLSSPPSEAPQPGAVGETGYSPLIQLPNGMVLNAPHVANDTGQADKVVSIDKTNLKVTYQETNGFQGGKPVRYISTDASDPVAATLENVTFAPALNNAPTAGDDSTHSARASLAAFTNGQTGAANPQRQGLNSALLDGLDPLNVLAWNPSQGRYSPLWDVHLVQWSQAAVGSGQNLRQTDFGHVLGLAKHGMVTNFGGGPFGPAGIIVNCPIVSMN